MASKTYPTSYPRSYGVPSSVSIEASITANAPSINADLSVDNPSQVSIEASIVSAVPSIAANLSVINPENIVVDMVIDPDGINNWYSTFGIQGHGSFTGDNEVVPGFTFDRVWWTDNSNDDFRINRNPSGTNYGDSRDMNTWLNENPGYYIHCIASGGTVSIPLATYRSIGGHWWNLATTVAQRTTLDLIGASESIRVVLSNRAAPPAEPADSVSIQASISSAVPSINVDLSVANPSLVSIEASITTGTPTLSANLSVDNPGQVSIQASISASAPIVSANLSVINPGVSQQLDVTTAYIGNPGRVEWSFTTFPDTAINPDFVEGRVASYLHHLELYDSGRILIRTAPSPTSVSSLAGPDFSEDFESDGEITIEVGSESLTIGLDPNEDATEPYDFTAPNVAEISAFVAAVRALSDRSGTITLFLNQEPAVNHLPVASFTISDDTVDPGQTITLTSTSTDPEGDDLTYSWAVTRSGLAYGTLNANDLEVVMWTAPTDHSTSTRTVVISLNVIDPSGSVGASVQNIVVNATPLPDAPTGITVFTLSTTQVTVSWTRPTNVTVVDQRIRYRVTGTTDWTISNGPSLSSISFNLENLETGTMYDVQVSARSGSGWGPWSVTYTGQTNSTFPDTPLAPTTTVVSNTQIRIDWIAPNDGGSVITHYDVRERIVGTSTWIQTSGFTALNATFAQLTPDREYEFQVRAANAIGNGLWSLSGTAQTTVIPTFGTSTVPNQSYTQNSPIATLQLPTAVSVDLPLTYSISPTLPAGLNFNANTLRITGTPTTAQTSTEYTYTVTDDDGDTDTLTFNIAVQAQVASSININTIPVKQNEVVRVLITAGQGGGDARWYSRIGSETFGTIEGDDVIATEGGNTFDLDRIWWRGTAGEFRINRDPLGTSYDTQADIDDYITSAAGQAKRIYVAVENSSGEAEIVEIDWTQYRNIAGHFVNINQIAADTITLLNTVSVNDRINLVIGEPIELEARISTSIDIGDIDVAATVQTEIQLEAEISAELDIGNIDIEASVRAESPEPEAKISAEIDIGDIDIESSVQLVAGKVFNILRTSIDMRFIVEIYSSNNIKIGRLETYESLSYKRVLNSVGDATFVVPRLDPLIRKMWSDGLATVPRRWRVQITREIIVKRPGGVPFIDTSIDWVGFIEGWSIERGNRDSSKNEKWTVHCAHVNEILRDYIMLPPSLLDASDLDGATINVSRTEAFDVQGPVAAETLLKNYVKSAIVSGIAHPVRSRSDFSVEADGGAGEMIAFAAQFENLLEQLVRLAEAGGIDFEVVVDPDDDTQYLFRTYYPYRGLDRRRGNGVNAEVLFSPNLTNINSAKYETSMVNQHNAFFLLGDGENESRTVHPAYDNDSIAIWGRREAAQDARGDDTGVQLITRGSALLEQNKERETATMQIQQTSNSIYGLNWDLGDLVTVDISEWGVTMGRQIRQVMVSLRSGQLPQFQIQVGDAPASVQSRLRSVQRELDNLRKR